MRKLWVVMAVTMLAGCGSPGGQSANDTEAVQTEAGPVKGFDRSHKGTPAPAALFKNPDGGDTSLTNFKGVPVLVNLWAT